MIEDIANAMVARLADQFEGFDAEHFPDKNAADELAKKKSTFYVNWDGSSFGELQSVAPLSINDELKFVVTIRVLGLRGPKGAMAIIPLVQKCFFGWEPTKKVDGNDVPCGASKMVPVDAGFVAQAEGSWRFACTFKTTVLKVEATTAETGPLFKELLWKDPVEV